jgi:DNA mismatch repair protein MutS
VNAERFITEELKQYEQKVLGAEEKLLQLEREEFLKVQESLYPFIPALKDLAFALATIDVLVGFATLAFDQKYCRPVFAEHKGVLTYTNGRHPVVEKFLSDAFVGNDLHLDKEKYIMLLTGPNMAGKSTYLRQTALIILMAHIGSFVPASSCVLDIFDRIFTRIGASDVLIKGQSTFLVEMQETANILNNATEKSFIILDEVGRGTSTYDGLSLAWSILEYLHHHTKAKVLFATHYHELIQVAESLPGAFNASMAVTENTDGVVFLRKVVPGGIDKSYGIEVAKISALPSIVIERAKEVLSLLEAEKEGTQQNTSQLSFLEPHIIETVKIVRRDSDIEKKIESLNLNDLTPIEALNLLWEMRKDLKKK